MKENHYKTIFWVVCGNILDYYDFLLFAHLGPVITAFFVPNLSAKETHMLGLLLFAMPFVIRPIGGYLFGRLSDLKGRQHALSETLKYASFASLGLAFLPSYEQGGIICAWVFFLLRSMQGLSLGGEYTTAGTFLMEKYSAHQGLVSGVLCASGTVGSLAAFFFAWLYMNNYLTGDSWRIAFIIGGIGTYISFLVRKRVRREITAEYKQNVLMVTYKQSVLITIMIGLLIGVLCWIPMVYANYYLTKVLNLPITFGLQATLIALVLYVAFTPIFGYLADRYSSKFVMTFGAFAAIPLGFIGFTLVQNGSLLGQVFLSIGAAFLGAPIHVVMNQLFPADTRSRSVNTAFMLGSSLGGLTPFICGYAIEKYQFDSMPILMVGIIGLMTFVTFYYYFYRDTEGVRAPSRA